MQFNPLVAISVLLLCSGLGTCSSSCCCGEGWPIFDADLTSGQHFIAPESGLSWAKTLSDPNSQTTCDRQGVLKIVFPQACNHMQKRRLQFDLYTLLQVIVVGTLTFPIPQTMDMEVMRDTHQMLPRFITLTTVSLCILALGLDIPTTPLMVSLWKILLVL